MAKITLTFKDMAHFFAEDFAKYDLSVTDNTSEFGFVLSNKYLKIVVSSEYFYDTVQVNFYRKDCDATGDIIGLSEVLGRGTIGGKYLLEYPERVSSELERKLFFNLHKLFFHFSKELSGDFSEWDYHLRSV